PYGALFGHRGFFHSLIFALIGALLAAWLTYQAFGLPWWWLLAYFFGVLASHGILDGFTNGGLGIAYFSPFHRTRYFFPCVPIQVSPIGRGFFSRWGIHAMSSELAWIWLPLAAVIGVVAVYRVFV